MDRVTTQRQPGSTPELERRAVLRRSAREVGPAHDRAEVEADRIADQVVASLGSEPPVGHHVAPSSTRIRRASGDGGRPRIQRMSIYWKGRQVRIPGKTDKNDIVDTLTLSAERRKELAALLANSESGRALLQRIEAEWGAHDKEQEATKQASAPPDLATLLAVGGELDRLDAVNGDLGKQDTEALAQVLAQLADAAARVANVDRASSTEDDLQVLVDTIQGLQMRAIKLWETRAHDQDVKVAFRPGTEPRLTAADITDAEVEAYRNDIRMPGVWGGLAEAEVGAAALRLELDIFRLDQHGVYRKIIRVGEGNQNVANRALLHLGNHYEVVVGAVAGQPHGPGNLVAATGQSGDCLFEALGIAKTGVLPPADKVAAFRNAVAQRLDPAQIRATLLQIAVLGDRGGLGPATSRLLKARRYTPDAVVEIARGVGDSDVRQAVRDYAEAWNEDPSSTQTAALLATILDGVKQATTTEIVTIPFESLDADVQAGRYRMIETGGEKVKTRYPSAESAFVDQAPISVAEAVTAAIDGLSVDGDTAEEYSRHDHQDSSSSTVNLQVQLGGRKLNFRPGKGDSSSTLVTVEAVLWKRLFAEDRDRLRLVVQEAHRTSFRNSSRLDFTEVPATATATSKKPTSRTRK